jgi:quercetin dioxygenase-like cupin family protein
MKQKNVDQVKAVEMLPGIARRTLAYNDDVMLCHFTFTAGAAIPLHEHAPSQIGFVISGRVRFIGATEADAFEVGPGDSYVVDSNVQHGAEVLEDTVLVEIFSPSRDEYKDS